jgi:hypothetical protein
MAVFRICLLLTLSAFSSIFASQTVVLFNDTSAWYHWGCTGTSTALKVCSLLEQADPLLFSDPELLDHLLLRTKVIFSSPIANHDAKVAEICELAEKNFDGLKRISL